jgi:sulfur-oxidizing protein SoxY
MRRRDLLAAAGAGIVVTLFASRNAAATPETMQAALREVTGGAPVTPGKVALEMPPVAENGNAVPLTVKVDSPMTPDAHVRSIHLFTERNPLPNVAHFHLGPRAGRAQVSTRMRLFDSQRILAVARLSDGSLWSASAEVIITLAACVEP